MWRRTCAREQGKEKITIHTGAGLKICQLTSRSDSEYEFEIEMGEAAVGDRASDEDARDREVHGIPVSMGNPHYVIFVPEFAEGLAGAGGGDPAQSALSRRA